MTQQKNLSPSLITSFEKVNIHEMEIPDVFQFKDKQKEGY